MSHRITLLARVTLLATIAFCLVACEGRTPDLLTDYWLATHDSKCLRDPKAVEKAVEQLQEKYAGFDEVIEHALTKVDMGGTEHCDSEVRERVLSTTSWKY